MKINKKHEESPSKKGENFYTPPPLRISKIWQIRVTFYGLLFGVTIVFLCQELYLEPLEAINRLNVPENSFLWTTFKRGVAIGYMNGYILLTVFYFMEYALCEFYSQERNYDVELIKTSKRIRIGIGITAILMAYSMLILLEVL